MVSDACPIKSSERKGPLTPSAQVRCARCAVRREGADSADSTRGTMLPDEHCTNAPGDIASRSHGHAETLSLPRTCPVQGNHTPGKSSPPAQALACRGHIWLLLEYSPVESCTHLLLLPVLSSIQARYPLRHASHVCSPCQESTVAIVESTLSRSKGFSMRMSFRRSTSAVSSSDETPLIITAGIRSSPGVACRWS